MQTNTPAPLIMSVNRCDLAWAFVRKIHMLILPYVRIIFTI